MQYAAGTYDCIVVGAGHAGCEAALAAARLGCKTMIATLNMENIGLMPCNPSIGGPAKGQLVREIDALGGEMGKNIDETYIQIRLLNTGKGPAVYALRAQADKQAYGKRMTRVLQNQENLDVKQILVEKIIVNDKREIEGIETETGAVYRAKTVILCTGTYLRGRIIIGEMSYQGGPNGQRAAMNLSASLKQHGIELGRFKTGTPARVDKRTVRFEEMLVQPGDEEHEFFSFMTEESRKMNCPCYLTYTNEETHEIIRKNLHRSPLFTGRIEGTGPRYCPSIEDKVVRFSEKERHQIFLEPEGLDTCEMYVQGMSSSLPEEVQTAFLRTVKGLGKVEIMRTGYAIEYDYVIPSQLKLSLEMKSISGLFCAGQINGSSGYEEAAAQGLIAGINAAMKIKGKEPLILKRSEAYIGVLIDDLVTKGTNEPYRLMTSRAEYRLLLRQDNADLRLTEIGWKIGLVTKERYEKFRNKKSLLENELKRLKETFVSPADERIKKILERKGSSPLRQGISLYDLLRRSEIEYKDLKEMELGKELPKEVIKQIDIQIKYEGYIEKQLAQVEKFERLESRRLPEDLPYEELKGLSTEARQKLAKLKPQSVGQASRVSGVSPADISVLLVYLEQKRRKEKKK
ncbi:MAG: tRNA uridine-5-carboxymethylaminomethyl(34) synthesis enzyme MnmG [Peptococcaceae bacterium]|jgi:tRNA uridine 5-carboxymethylaminomethyl modification enzyme|nr:tRNA uridine-5-carboxymethylaminomethyl(34) synthesis enzyme MnmG [Peptococcaceae bacterium]MDH7523819.1 tRNA uridine-5-carboxymethylaminomethyl(34) synthesis enzyme MnmG [Peptococcaceae bacterium]